MRHELAAVLLGVLLASGAPAQEAEAPRLAGSEVPVPKRKTFVAPEYPPEAVRQGLRGIVILELVIDTDGRVASVSVVRSVPPFDEAALTAVRQWRYEVTRVDGQPVPVRLTVPITFALRLPDLESSPGIPELRQGATVAYPRDGAGRARVEATVSTLPDGQVAEAAIDTGESPWAEAVLAAVRTWRFAPVEGPELLVFKLEVRFEPGSGSSEARVRLRLSEPRREALEVVDETAPPQPPRAPQPASPQTPAPLPAPAGPEAGADEAAPAAAPGPTVGPTEPPPPPDAAATPAPAPSPAPEPPAVTPAPAPAAEPPAATSESAPAPAAVVPAATPEPAPAAAVEPPTATSESAPAPAAEAPAATPEPAPAAAAEPPAATSEPVPEAQLTPAAPAAAPPPTAAPATPPEAPAPVDVPAPATPRGAAPGPPAPPVEVLASPARQPTPTPTPATPGVSLVRDVTLAVGVPDLDTGRRPVAPPWARIQGTSGVAEVTFAVDAGGVTSVSRVNGPEVLREAARQTVSSWVFRRTTTERLFLLATFTYEGDVATARVTLER